MSRLHLLTQISISHLLPCLIAAFLMSPMSRLLYSLSTVSSILLKWRLVLDLGMRHLTSSNLISLSRLIGYSVCSSIYPSINLYFLTDLSLFPPSHSSFLPPTLPPSLASFLPLSSPSLPISLVIHPLHGESSTSCPSVRYCTYIIAIQCMTSIPWHTA